MTVGRRVRSVAQPAACSGPRLGHRGGRVQAGRHGACRAVDAHEVTVDQRGRGRAGDHAGQPEAAGDDRGVSGRTTLLGDEGEDQRRVEAGGVGRGQVRRNQHVRVPRVRQSRGRGAVQLGDHPVADVAHVGGPLGQVAAEARELDRVLVGHDPHGALGGDSVIADELLCLAGECRVVGHHRGGREDLGDLVGGRGGTGGEVLGHSAQRPGQTLDLGVYVWCGSRGRLGAGTHHTGHRTDDYAGADTHTSQLGGFRGASL